MTVDPIVAEVRAVREQLFKECDYSLDKVVAYLHRQRKQLGLKVVRLAPQFCTVAAGDRIRDSQKSHGMVNAANPERRPTPAANIRKRKAM